MLRPSKGPQKVFDISQECTMKGRLGSRRKKISKLPRMQASKYWQYASEKARTRKKKSRSGQERSESRRNKGAQDIRMSINPSNVKSFPFLSPSKTPLS
jgi:hypothetical protein